MNNLFFEKVSEHCNYMDPKSVQKIYMGIENYIAQELLRNGEVDLPNIGKFYTQQCKERVRKMPSGDTKLFPDVMMVRFKTSRKLKLLFNKNPNIR